MLHVISRSLSFQFSIVTTISFVLLLSCAKKEAETSSDLPAPIQNHAPQLSPISNSTFKTDKVLLINYQVYDQNNNLDCISSVSVTSSNQTDLPLNKIIKGGTAPNCTLTVTTDSNTNFTSEINLVVSDGELSSSQVFSIASTPVTSISANISSLSLATNGTSQVHILTHYSDGSNGQLDDVNNSNWTTSSASIAAVNNLDKKGLIQGVSNGTATITANYKGLSASVNVQVISVQSVTLSTGSLSAGRGSQRSVTLTAQTTSSSFDVTSSALWSTDNPLVATVIEGKISFLSEGLAIITASYGAYSATVNISVLNKTLSLLQLTLSGGGAEMPANGIKKMLATGVYTDSTNEDLTSSVTWSSSNPSVAIISNTLGRSGEVTSLAAGTTVLSATVGSLNTSFNLTVNNVTLSSITLTPDSPLLAPNGKYQLRAIGSYSDGSTAEITSLANWSSSNTSVASISNTAGEVGLVTTPNRTGYASSTITATHSGRTGATLLGVNGASIQSILVTPAATLTPSETYLFKSYANLSDGGVIDLSQFSIWSSDSTQIATVSNAAGSIGLVTGVSAGTTNIKSTFGGQQGTSAVSVGSTSLLSEVGVGLKAEYFNWSGTSPPPDPFTSTNKKGQRIDATVAFGWAIRNAPMGVADNFAVRWTGFYKATSTNNYFCTNSDDGVRVWVNGVRIINNWTAHSATWDCSANVALTIGQKYSIRMEFFEAGGDATAFLTHSSISSSDAQNITTKKIPQSRLFPE